MERRKSRGRPPNFEEARRPITVTLPERVLHQLAALHVDRARAIVKATTLAIGFDKEEHPLVDVVEVRPGEALIIVGPSKRLLEIEWLRLVEIAPARHLLVIPTGTTIEQLEVAVGDMLDRLSPEEKYERELLTELHRLLRYRRQQQEVSKAEILLINIRKK
ncbi:MAG: hypothetical protein EPN23_05595 [Verrucomicrobia bacterium]|nr:MAG: hypothetical protein EPN23_05595 [Verrucomicrobiota bacterium]